MEPKGGGAILWPSARSYVSPIHVIRRTQRGRRHSQATSSLSHARGGAAIQTFPA